MAKKSIVEREIKRAKLVEKYFVQRSALKEIIRNVNTTEEDRSKAQAKLNALPRDSSPSRIRNRCSITGRPGARRASGNCRAWTVSRPRWPAMILRSLR